MGVTTCAICKSTERRRLETLSLGGASLRSLAKQFNFHRDQVHRHMRNHVPASTRAVLLVGKTPLEQLRAKAAEEKGSVLEHLTIARSMTLNAMMSTAEAASWPTFTLLVGRYTETNRAIAQITGELERLSPSIAIQNNIAIMSDPRMIQLQSGLLTIARAHPAARQDIVGLLRRLDAAPSTALATGLPAAGAAMEPPCSRRPPAAFLGQPMRRQSGRL
jgi:hypothetical protein